MAAPQAQETRLQYAKWDGTEHWGADLALLGEDEHGTWLGGRAGTRYARPGHTFDACPHVVLLPRDGWWIATFYLVGQGAREQFDLYVDVTTPPTVAEGEVFAVDLDLDVIRRIADGRVEIDDEDEFEDHRVRMSYPPRVVAAARETADRIAGMVRAEEAPFDGAHEAWLARVS